MGAVPHTPKDLERKLDELYSELERNYPPNTFSAFEHEWNDGFYRGQLKALELVARRVFGKSGDELAPASPSKRALRKEES